jgi:hypothetical protein
VVSVFLDQSARLDQDVLDALGALAPPSELVDAQQAFFDAWKSSLDLIVKVRDASFPTADDVLERIEAPVFRNAAAEIRSRCDDLQAAVAEAGSDVDLVCDGRLS